MRDVAQRLSALAAPILDRIPDLSAQPPRRQATIGLVASVAVHLLLFLFFVLGAWLFPSKIGFEDAIEKPQESLEIEVVPLPKQESADMALDEQAARRMMMSNGLEKSPEKPENAEFEADQDMVAGSELPASGLLPLPSQEGRTDRDSTAFADQDVILGLNKPGGAKLQLQNARPVATNLRGNEPPRAIYKPQPLTKEQLDAANVADAHTALPAPAATPPPRPAETVTAATPPPLRDVPQPAEDEMALAVAKPATPPPSPAARQEKPLDMVEAPITRPAMQQPPMEVAKLSTPAPATTKTFTDRYRESLEKTRIEGSISNIGRPGVNAVGTPLGAYMKGMSNTIGSRWNYYVKERMEWLSVGSVRVTFSVDQQGRVRDVKVVANDSNRNFADVCVQAIRDSKLEPLPPEALALLKDGKLEVPFTFTLYPSH